MALFSGVLGAVSAGVPLRYLIDGFGWRAVMAASGVLLLFISLACLRFIRDDPAQRGFRSYSPTVLAGFSAQKKIRPLAGLGRVFSFEQLAPVLGPRGDGGAYAEFCRSLGCSLSGGPLWDGNHFSRRRRIINDDLLGRGRSFAGSFFRSTGPAQAPLRAGPPFPPWAG